METSRKMIVKKDKNEALKIIKEAALWLIEQGKPLWTISDIENEISRINKEDFHVLFIDNISVAAMILDEDGKGLWNGCKESLFIHKLSVKRKYSGKGYAKQFINYAIECCVRREKRFLRLDCDGKRKKLCDFYEKVGFELKTIKSVSTEKYGDLYIALYEIDTFESIQLT